MNRRLRFCRFMERTRSAPRGGVALRTERTPAPRRHSLRVGHQNRARWPPYAPFCSDGIGLSVLPGALRLLGLAPVGCRRLTRSRANVTAGRIILDAGCVVSAPLPVLSGPPLARGHHSEGGGTFLSGPEGPPSAVRGLLAARAIHGGLFGVADVRGSESATAQNSNIETAWGPGGGTALLGFAGIAIVERNRGRTEEPTRRKWDRPRLAALASIVAGGLFFLPGLIVGFVYLPGYVRLVFAVQIAGWLALSVSVGVYLFLTARRIDQAAWRLSLIALAFGLAAAGLTTILTIAAQ